MILQDKYIPVGALPYTDLGTATRMEAKLFEKLPFIAFLPNCFPEDTWNARMFGNIPGIKLDGDNISILLSTPEAKKGIQYLDKAFNHPDLKHLEPFAMESPFMEKFFQLIKKFKSPNAIINVLGPFTVSQILTEVAANQVIVDKSFRKLFIQTVCVKALWVIKKIKEINPNITPIVMLEEPMLGQFGLIKRQNEDITADLVTLYLSRVIDKLREAGAIVGVQCLEKCDWTIPINAGVDIISFDAYNNPNNLNIISDVVAEFIRRGGYINWGIVPAMSESMTKGLNINIVEKRLLVTMEGLILAGIPPKDIYKSAIVSTQGDVDKLPVIFAEKLIMLTIQLAKKLAVKSVVKD